MITALETKLRNYLKEIIETTKKLCAGQIWIAVSLLNSCGLKTTKGDTVMGDSGEVSEKENPHCLCPQKVGDISDSKNVHKAIEETLCTLFSSFEMEYFPKEF